MNIRKSLSLLAIGLSLAAMAACSPANKTDKAASNDDIAEGASSVNVASKVAPVIEKMSSGTYTAKNSFPGPEGSGLVGVIFEPKNGSGNKQIGWATADGEYVTLGPLLDKNGQDLSEKAMTEHGGLLTPEQLAQRVLDENLGFIAGKSGPVATVFFEPYCGYCNKMFNDLKPRIDAGKIRVRFIMVPFLSADSAARGAAINTAKDPYKALKKWEALADKHGAPAANVSEEDQQVVRRGGQMFNEANLGGTPASLICNKNTKTLEVVRGYPVDGEAFAASLGDEGHAICKP
jgi:thiol:disulfide interchange protein DsbG